MYIIQEYLFAGANHLWIGLLGGLILGGAAAAIYKSAKSGQPLKAP